MADAGGRDLRRDGCRVDVMLYAEVRDFLAHFARSWAMTRRARGEPVRAGELKGPGPATSWGLTFLASLCDEDLIRALEEGRRLESHLSTLPPEHGRVPGRIDAAAIPRRTTSIFAAGAGAAYAPPPDLRALGGYDVRAHDRRDVDEPVAEPQPQPRRRRARRV